MLKEIRLRNYRTHISTKLELQPVTLLIGNNNSGKSNLLNGLWHFAKLVSRARPGRQPLTENIGRGVEVVGRDLFPHRHRLANKNDPMALDCVWQNQYGYIVKYTMELYENHDFENHVSCVEKISISENNTPIELKPGITEFTTGISKKTNLLSLREELTRIKIDPRAAKALDYFFLDVSHIFLYYFQPSFLKGRAQFTRSFREHFDSDEEGKRVHIPSALGFEGGNFQEIIHYIQENDEKTYQRFVAALRRFDTSFQGIRFDDESKEVRWQFDLGSPSLTKIVEEFNPSAVSDGLVKAAVVSLLTSLEKPPSVCLLEEIENGINPGNIREFLSWIFKASSTTPSFLAPQFILTSHSPAVIREFHDKLTSVYNIRLDKSKHCSDVRNLNIALDNMVGIGTVEGEIIEIGGKRTIKIAPKELTELWLSGSIG